MGDIFLSYVREDLSMIGRLVDALEAVGVSVWWDQAALLPGMRWKDEIRSAIRTGSRVIVVFSKNGVRKGRSYANEELLLIVEELRLRPRTDKWLHPCRLDECIVPDMAIGGGERLSDIQSFDLFPDFDTRVRVLANFMAR
jgi:hypothetical protein